MKPASGRIQGRIERRDRLDAASLDAMWRLFDSHYADVTRSRFEADLSKKCHVILLNDSGNGQLVGFSTLEVWDRVVEERPVTVVFSGDTIVSPDYWGQNVLHLLFARFAFGLKCSRPRRPMYWFLLTKGYKTYLLLTRNFGSYWPRAGHETPVREAALLSSLAFEKFGSAWRPAEGIVHFDTPKGRLREEVAPIPASLQSDRDVRFFLESNPQYMHGDELCCLGLFDRSVWFAALRKAWS